LASQNKKLFETVLFGNNPTHIRCHKLYSTLGRRKYFFQGGPIVDFSRGNHELISRGAKCGEI